MILPAHWLVVSGEWSINLVEFRLGSKRTGSHRPSRLSDCALCVQEEREKGSSFQGRFETIPASRSGICCGGLVVKQSSGGRAISAIAAAPAPRLTTRQSLSTASKRPARMRWAFAHRFPPHPPCARVAGQACYRRRRPRTVRGETRSGGGQLRSVLGLPSEGVSTQPRETPKIPKCAVVHWQNLHHGRHIGAVPCYQQPDGLVTPPQLGDRPKAPSLPSVGHTAAPPHPPQQSKACSGHM